MNDERLAELKEKYKNRNLLEELAWGIYYNHSGYTPKQNGEFLNWLCLMAYKALKERPQGEWIPVSERLPEESLNSVIGWDAYRERCVFVQYIDGHFQIMGNDESFDIVAWQPVPEPYMKGGKLV